jgi:hypothetical protein
LNELLDSKESNVSLEAISSNEEKRTQFALMVLESLRGTLEAQAVKAGLGESSQRQRRSALAMSKLSKFISSDDEDADLASFVKATIRAFFDNDLLHSTRLFLRNAKGSFGLMIASSLDAHRQTCFAARGQTMSIAFYPRKGLICYGSEQAAVKAGLNYENPGGNIALGDSREADNAVRLDLDDLGGEICLLDWGFGVDAEAAISPPNRHLVVEKMMNNRVNVVLLRQSPKKFKPSSKRLTLLENNEFIKPLLMMDQEGTSCTTSILETPYLGRASKHSLFWMFHLHSKPAHVAYTSLAYPQKGVRSIGTAKLILVVSRSLHKASRR